MSIHHTRCKWPLHTARRGFTMVEVIVIVTVLALLMTVVTTNVMSSLGKSHAQLARTQAAKVAQALNMYLIETGQSSPEDGFDLTVLTLRSDDGGGPGGPYLPKAGDIIDPWGNQFMVISPGEINADFDVLSYGKDAAPGGEGVNSDLTQ